MKGILSAIFGGSNRRELSRLQPQVDKINQLEADFEKLSDSQLKEKTQEFKERLNPPAGGGETLDQILSEVFAAVREAAKRAINQRHFDVQLIGGIVLHQGKIAEMKTGEGKTLVATLPLYLNALSGKGAHLVTVNDYLAKFQGEWMGRIYDQLGLKTGVIQNLGVSFIFERGWGKENKTEQEQKAAEVWDDNLKPCSRKEAYAADITYGTNNEFGFDYLRDNMAQDTSQVVQGDLNYAIVDEVDSILIDEARTPLIISSPAEESADLYAKFAALVPRLTANTHYTVDEKMRAVSLTDAGVEEIEKILGIENVYQPQTISLVHHLEEALKAQILFKKDKDYIVRDGEVVIVDEFTGRLMPGRRYSEGLHQAIEAKEGVEIKRESDTLATISFQNFFRLYKKLAGMTGTAATEAEEFHKIYKLDVSEIPTHEPMIRRDLQDQIYKTEEAKFNAIVSKIKELNEKGQPILVGTISIEKSEHLSRLLKRAGIKHAVLNAKQHEKEAKIIIQAGRSGMVTVATNMAGRGVDIILGGNPPDVSDADRVKKVDGLFVLGTERHESRRIDNQLRGRSGRQGDSGVSQFYISMEDDLMRIFGGERLRNMMERLGLPEDQPIEHSLISKSIESAQRRVEGHNFDIRKHLVEYDDVMNKQREVFYRRRRKILYLDPAKDETLHNEILGKLTQEETNQYNEQAKSVDPVTLRAVEKKVFLSVMDQSWVEHLNTMDELRDSIGLRGYGQVDPLIAYKEESLTLFEGLMRGIDEEAVGILLKIDFSAVQAQVAPQPPEPNPLEYHGADPVGGWNANLNEENIPKSGEEVIEAAEGRNLGLNEKETAVVPVEEEVAVAEKSLPAEAPAEVPSESRGIKKSSGVVTTVRSVSEKMEKAVQAQAVPGQKVGRNDPCPCGAKKPDGRPVKYKHCCGR